MINKKCNDVLFVNEVNKWVNRRFRSPLQETCNSHNKTMQPLFSQTSLILDVFPAKWSSSSEPPTQTFLGLSRVPPHERLFNGRATSVHWRLAFVSKEPIHCSVNFDISVVCVPGCLPCAHTRYLLSGAKCGKEGLFREMLLPCI